MTPTGNKRFGSAEDWLKHSASDLHYAGMGRADANVLRAHVCFHAQQAVEKALKAVLLHSHIDFPPVHDLHELTEIAKNGGLELPPFLAESDMLTPYAAETRYPADWDEITENDVETALSLAEQVSTWANAFIKKAAQ